MAFHHSLPADRHAPARARRALRAALGGHAEEWVERVALLTSEVVTNSVRHGGTAPDGAIDLRVLVYPDRVRVEVTDDGAGFVPAPPQPRPDEGRSFGLWLVHRLAQEWGVTSDPCCVWFEVATDGDGASGDGAAP